MGGEGPSDVPSPPEAGRGRRANRSASRALAPLPKKQYLFKAFRRIYSNSHKYKISKAEGGGTVAPPISWFGFLPAVLHVRYPAGRVLLAEPEECLLCDSPGWRPLGTSGAQLVLWEPRDNCAQDLVDRETSGGPAGNLVVAFQLYCPPPPSRDPCPLQGCEKLCENFCTEASRTVGQGHQILQSGGLPFPLKIL